jgi:hypothetical protein
MRRSASEIIRNLENRVARLEKQSSGKIRGTIRGRPATWSNLNDLINSFKNQIESGYILNNEFHDWDSNTFDIKRYNGEYTLYFTSNPHHSHDRVIKQAVISLPMIELGEISSTDMNLITKSEIVDREVRKNLSHWID